MAVKLSSLLGQAHDSLSRRAAISAEPLEDGFTILELLVVQLVISILLAIAIPTYMGTTATTYDRAAESNLATALGAAKTIFYTQLETYPVTAALVAALNQQEPELTFVATTSTDRNTVGVEQDQDASGNTGVVLVVRSQSGTCWYITDSPLAPVPSHGGSLPVGVRYGSLTGTGTTCTTDWTGVTDWSFFNWPYR